MMAAAAPKPVQPRPLKRLPAGLENVEKLLARRAKAVERKSKWVSLYREAYEYALPQRETFNQQAEGSRRGRDVYDSTAEECVHEAANRLQAKLTPPWREWCQFGPGSEVDPEEADDPAMLENLQRATNILFHHLNHSNLSSVLAECYLDLQVGTCALTCDEGDGERLLVFRAVPLSEIELEEGPWGTVETEWCALRPQGRNLERMFPGIELSTKTAALVKKDGSHVVEVVYGCIYEPKTQHYYGVVIEQGEKHLAWRYDYGLTSPYIVARASVTPGELYGRGRVLRALPNIRTLNTVVEFVLRHSAVQIAPPYTGVTDGVLNPYTATFAPNTIIPVASNHDNNPSLRVLESGGNFNIGEALIERLQDRVRKALLSDTRRNEGPIATATEVAIEDRDLLEQQGSEFGRVQVELLTAIIRRATDILTRRGKLPALRIDGKLITLKYVSPLARAQDAEDLLAIQRAFEVVAPLGPEVMHMGFKTEKLPAAVARKTGMDQALVRTEDEQGEFRDRIAEMMAKLQAQGAPAPA